MSTFKPTVKAEMSGTLGSKRQARIADFFGMKKQPEKVQKTSDQAQVPVADEGSKKASPAKHKSSSPSKSPVKLASFKEEFTASVKEQIAKTTATKESQGSPEKKEFVKIDGQDSVANLVANPETISKEAPFQKSKYAQPPQYGKAMHSEFPKGHASIWSWNINGLNANIEKGTLKTFLEEADPDIICLNETKTDLKKIAKNAWHAEIPQGYEQYWNCCKIRGGYSGVAILSKVKPLQVMHDIQVSKHDEEGRVLTAEFPQFYLVAVYVPNAGEGLKRLDYRVDEWDKDFQTYLNALGKRKPVVLTGDLNVAHKEIDIYDPKGKHKVAGFTPSERASFDRFLRMGWVDTFRYFYPMVIKYSFWTWRFQNLRKTNRGWRLDYFVVTKNFMPYVVDSTIHNEFYGSDHCPIQLHVDLTGETYNEAASQHSQNS